MELVDGKKNQLVPPEIIMGAVDNLGLSNDFSMLVSGSLQTSNDATPVQVNNTMFTYLSGEKGKQKEIVVYVHNMDIQANFHGNILKFLTVVQKRGVTGVYLICRNPDFLGAFLKILPVLKKYKVRAGIGEKKSRQTYLARVTFDNKIIGAKV